MCGRTGINFVSGVKSADKPNLHMAIKQKNFALADQLRGKILERGYVVIDRPNGFEVKKK